MLSTEPLNILLVDDRSDGLTTLQAVLRNPGYRLVTASSGPEALLQLLKQEFVLVVLDVQMPDMDGFETAALIKTQEKLKHIPIIFVTGVFGDTRHTHHGYEVGAIDYITKPYDPYILRSKVAVLVDLHRKTQQLRQIEKEEHERNLLELRRNLEIENLRAREEDLSRSNKELELFAHVVSHDLKEPLRMVTSYVQLLKTRYAGELDAQAEEFIGYAVSGARRMQVLIEDLLKVARLGTRQQEFTQIELGRVLEAATSNLEVTINETGTEVTHGKLPTVRGNSTELMQLFQNLIANAIKFRGTQAPQIHVSAEKYGGEWLIDVRDNGIGIKPEYKERIFVIFQRLHTEEKYPGTGVGLAVCKKIVERHGGRIWADSVPGKGSTFHFTLPNRV